MHTTTESQANDFVGHHDPMTCVCTTNQRSDNQRRSIIIIHRIDTVVHIKADSAQTKYSHRRCSGVSIGNRKLFSSPTSSQRYCHQHKRHCQYDFKTCSHWSGILCGCTKPAARGDKSRKQWCCAQMRAKSLTERRGFLVLESTAHGNKSRPHGG